MKFKVTQRMLKPNKIKSSKITLGFIALSAPEVAWYTEIHEAGKKELEKRGIAIVEAD